MSTPVRLGLAVGLPVAAALGFLLADLTRPAGASAEQVQAVLDRLDDVEQALAEQARTDETTRRQLGHVEDRLTALERGALERVTRPDREAGADRDSRATSGASDDASTSSAVGTTDGEPDTRPSTRELDALTRAREDAAVRAADIEQRAAALTAMRAKVTAMKLKLLPEDERWQRVAELVGMNEGQTEHVRDALRRRDQEWRDAMDVRVETLEGGGFRKVVEVDEARIDAAGERFDAEVGQILNDEQRSAWSSNGIADAVGLSRPIGSVYESPKGGK